MPVYVSLLRAVNVTGHNSIVMKELTAMYEALGYENVRTYIQSGNVVFHTAPSETGDLERVIEKKINETFGLETTVMVRTGGQMQEIVTGNPFPESEPGKVAVGFLSGEPATPDFERITKTIGSSERLEISGTEAYLYYPDGQGRSKMTTSLIERALGVTCTMRNWRTVNKLLDLAQE